MSEAEGAKRQALRIVHMGFKDHGWTRVVLQTLLEADVVPVLVLEEDSVMASRKGPWYCAELSESEPVPPPCASQVEAYNASHPELEQPIKYACVANHNEASDIISAASPDILFFGTTRIIKPSILALPLLGSLNCHPSMPGGYSGAIVFIREIIDDVPLGAMCHWATDKLDLGDVMSAEYVPVARNDTLSTVMWKLLRTAGRQAVKSIQLIEHGMLTGVPQTQNALPAFRWPDDELIKQAKLKLQNREYACYAD